LSLLSSRRRPWPYHARMGSILGSQADRVGLLLLPNQEGLLVGRKQQMLDAVVPSVQEYGSAPVYRERTFPLRPTGGYGERVQASYGDKRYYWGLDVQVAGGLFGKGPLLHPIMPTTVAGGSVTKFIDAPTAVPTVFDQFVLSRRDWRTAATTRPNLGQVVDKNVHGPASDHRRSGVPGRLRGSDAQPVRDDSATGRYGSAPRPTCGHSARCRAVF
jgi:hypothetical protein